MNNSTGVDEEKVVGFNLVINEIASFSGKIDATGDDLIIQFQTDKHMSSLICSSLIFIQIHDTICVCVRERHESRNETVSETKGADRSGKGERRDG